jgi:type IV pilus assembly protein PilW
MRKSADRHSLASAARAAGFSLVELMVAVALSLLLLGGVVAMFQSSRTSYEATDHLSRIQESGRFALDQLTRHMRSAGYVGCARQPTYISTSLNNSNLLQWNFLDGAVRGYQATGTDTWSPTIDASVTSPASGSDVLVLRVPARDAEPLRLTADMANGTNTLTIPNVTTGVRTGDIVLAYSCEAQSYFQATSVAGGVITHAAGAGSPGNALDTINYAFRMNAEVIPVETVVYYVRASSAATLPAGTTSLWRRTALGNPEELIEGVERMELEFGVDTNGDTIVDAYQTANNVANWGDVYSVSVALLVRSLEQYGTDRDQRTYQLLNVSVAAPADRRLREVFSATASIRNRLRVN